MTTVHPAARAGPILRVIIAEGKFHGVRIELKSQAQVGVLQRTGIHIRDTWVKGTGCQKDVPSSQYLYVPTGCLTTMERVFGSGFGMWSPYVRTASSASK